MDNDFLSRIKDNLHNDITPTEETDIIKVPVARLPESEGVVAEDVVSPTGVVLLPAGVEIGLFDSSIQLMAKKMSDMGIKWVYLHAPQQLTEIEIEKIIDRVYSDEGAIISKGMARNVVKHVDDVFTTIRNENDLKPEMVVAMSNIGADLTEELLKNPSVTFSLGKVIDADEYTFVHSFNVAVLTGYLSNRVYGDDREFIEKVVLGALLHDIGKAKIPLEVLNKPGPLTNKEFYEMRRHPGVGVGMAIQSGIHDKVILSVIGGHHEKWSGGGYPNGQMREEIPEPARISAVADVFDALTARRVYKEPMSSRNAITLILKDSGTHFDPRIAREMLVSIGLYPPGSIVALSDGRVGVVMSGGGKDLVRPVVMIRSQKQQSKNAADTPEFIDLKKVKNLAVTKYLGHGDKRLLTEELAKNHGETMRALRKAARVR